MLVRLYDLPSLDDEIRKMEGQGIRIIRAFPPNREHIVSWIKEHSSLYAAGEAECCFSRKRPTLFIAASDN